MRLLDVLCDQRFTCGVIVITILAVTFRKRPTTASSLSMDQSRFRPATKARKTRISPCDAETRHQPSKRSAVPAG
jgi:hypothetical protein